MQSWSSPPFLQSCRGTRRRTVVMLGYLVRRRLGIPKRPQSGIMGPVSRPLRLRQPMAFRVYVGAFGLFWCGFGSEAKC